MMRTAFAKALQDSKDPDIFGKALLDYFNGNYTENITVHSSITEDDEIPLPYLFRNFDEMPVLEQKALQLVKGKILDIGACAGSHSLYLQRRDLDVTALDQSSNAVKVIKKRGVYKAVCAPLLNFKSEKFDTILLLMNGTGIFERMSKIDHYLKHLKSLLLPDGQILIDSTDINYMFEEEDGSYWVDLNRDYYGEVIFEISYKKQQSKPFEWLYLDFATLRESAAENGFKAEILEERPSFEYLARLTIN